MPTYAYACPDCGHQFDKVQKFSDHPLKVCPNCKKRNIHRVINKVNVAFKGSGFYVNDSKSKSSTQSHSKKEKAAEETKPTTTETKPAETKAETTSETKTEAKAEKPAKKEKSSAEK